MAFDENHYTRDWTLLNGVAAEWADLCRRFGIKSGATGPTIDRHWDELYAAIQDRHPSLRRLYVEVTRDSFLHRALAHRYFRCLDGTQRRDQPFDAGRHGQDGDRPDVRTVATLRVFRMIVRNARNWAAGQLKGDSHWGRFYGNRRPHAGGRSGPDNLTTELVRAIKTMAAGPRVVSVGLPEAAEQPHSGQSDIVDDLDWLQANGLSAADARVYEAWLWNLDADEPRSDDQLAGWLGLTPAQLNAALRRVAAVYRSRN